MASQKPEDIDVDSEPELLAEEDALEEFEDAEGDIAMDSDDDEDAPEEITLHNDSIAFFDGHKDSIFTIAQHPKYPSLIATGGSEGDADDAPGKGYVFDISSVASKPVLPSSYNSDPSGGPQKSPELQTLFSIEGHSDSINTLAFTLPNGDFLVSGGLDGRIRVYAVSIQNAQPQPAPQVAFLAEAQEVPEVNWLAPCPDPAYPNTIALGASDGSIWVYTIDASDASNPLQIVQSYFLHTAPSTAGAWTPDGQLLATVSEDSSLYVWDVFGTAAAKGLLQDNGQTAVSLTGADQRFEVEGGLYSVAVAPSGAFLAAGGAGGAVKIVGLPRLSDAQAAPGSSSSASAPAPQKQKQTQRGARANPRGPGGPVGGGEAASAQAGAILASLQAQSDSIETLSFAPAPQTLLAAGSVDGSIVVYDTGRSFGVRRNIRGAHDEFSVVKVEFVRNAAGPAAAGAGWLLTSCGMDGVVRRWDLRGATASQAVSGSEAAGLAKEWRGHRGDGEGGGVLGFVQGEGGERIVTAGDDGVVLVFEA